MTRTISAVAGSAKGAVRNAGPGCFAIVMATGITSRAVQLDGIAWLSDALLGIAIAAYAVLIAVCAVRLAVYPGEIRRDATDPCRAFGFFTFAAGSDVLAARLAGERAPLTAVLLVIGGISWVVLSYTLPAVLAASGTRPALAGADGSWFLQAVAAQSVAVGLTSLPRPVPPGVTDLAIACWAVGVLFYLLTAGLVTAAALAYPGRAGHLTPDWWVFMGATAISVLAGAQILAMPPDPLQLAIRPVLAGLCVLLWAFGTWLIPLLAVLGGCRHVRNRVPVIYEPGLWSLVFPVGMYGVGSRELGVGLRVPWLMTLGRDESWVALALWVAVFAAMLAACVRAWPRPSDGGRRAAAAQPS